VRLGAHAWVVEFGRACEARGFYIPAAALRTPVCAAFRPMSVLKNAILMRNFTKFLFACEDFTSGIVYLALIIAIFKPDNAIPGFGNVISGLGIVIPSLGIVISGLGIAISGLRIAISGLRIAIPKPEIALSGLSIALAKLGIVISGLGIAVLSSSIVILIFSAAMF
jgi:hypothetical protein